MQVVIERLGGRAPNLAFDHSGTDDCADSIAGLVSLKSISLVFAHKHGHPALAERPLTG